MSLESLLSVPEIAQAVRTLQAIADDPIERALYEARAQFQRDQSAGIKDARIVMLRSMVLRVGEVRFKSVPLAVNDAINAMVDENRLKDLFDQVFDANDWNSLFSEERSA